MLEINHGVIGHFHHPATFALVLPMPLCGLIIFFVSACDELNYVSLIRYMQYYASACLQRS